MNASTFLVLLPWWCEQLVGEILWSVWVRAENAWQWGGLPMQTLYQRRFERLVFHMDCWPCRVSWGRNSGLLVTSKPCEDEDDFGRDYDDWQPEEQSA